MKKIILVHGYKGSPKIPSWFEWLSKELEQKDFSVRVPNMPTPSSPVVKEWNEKIEMEADGSFEDVIFVGHSLGGLAIMHAIQDRRKNEQAKAVILVGTPIKDVNKPKIKDFLPPLDWEKISRNAKEIICVYSKDDPYVSFEHGTGMSKILNGTLVEFKDKKHFQDQKEFKELLNVILELG